MTIRSKRMPTLAAISILVWCCGVAAEPLPSVAPGTPAPIDLQAAIRLALEQPGLRAAAYEVAASEAAVDQAGRYPNPELEYLREGQQAGTRTTTVQINQPIELGGKRRARLALAQGGVTLARGELAAQRQDIRSDVIAGYYAVLVAQERQQLAQSLIELARRGVDVASKRVAAGKISPIDETKARLAAVDASVELSQASGELAIARTKLGALIGKRADAITLAAHYPEQLPDVKPLAALLAAVGDSAPVQRARGHLAAQVAQTDVERAARIPDVTVSVGRQRDDEARRRQTVVGLSVPLPLFNRNGGNLSAALRRSDKAHEELAAAQVSAASDLENAYTRYAVARNEVALLRQDVLPNASSAYALTLKGFEFGKFSYLDVLDAQRTLFQSRSRHWNALLAAWRAFADIERFAGAATTTTQHRSTELESHP
ncbi:TolC family protein [Massilia sp. CMS3.1]|uniref:TolC family protein n=1 Tax=Massilia sp. CMS3.1 TaxID=3373083 RepID=UPI003EE53206